jgi:16S rRNA (cytidine1402-2'-O)-methyltransferase
MKNLDLLEHLEGLELLENIGRGKKKIIIGRELTKMFEEVLRGTIEDIRNYFTENPGKQKGEFVVIVY